MHFSAFEIIWNASAEEAAEKEKSEEYEGEKRLGDDSQAPVMGAKPGAKRNVCNRSRLNEVRVP